MVLVLTPEPSLVIHPYIGKLTWAHYLMNAQQCAVWEQGPFPIGATLSYWGPRMNVHQTENELCDL